MSTFIKLIDFRDSFSKQEAFNDLKNRFSFNQDDFFQIPGYPIAYWISKQTQQNFSNKNYIGQLCDTREGMATADNNRFTRQWFETSFSNVLLNAKSREDALISGKKWFPYASGGEYRRWYGNQDLTVNWKNDGEEIRNFKDDKGRIRSHNYNLDHIFKIGLTWTSLSSNKFAVRLMSDGFLFSGAGTGLFTEEQDLNYLLSLLNTELAYQYLNIINPTINYTPGNVSNFPIVFPTSIETKNNINTKTTKCIEISKEEWDSRETSWDFRQNELIRHKTDDGKIASAFSAYCNYWREKFVQLHTNEEELNRLFIEIYGLQEELTPDVALEDITILKSESKIVDYELVFNADEIARQFISYSVGCMFGRYSLDREGLVVANMGQAIPTDTSFEIDDDNIIPVLEEEVFSDDIASRFERFVAVAFGEAFVGENIRWIEQSVGMDIRKYFVAEFYKDHVRRYKKRPIYWMVQSPKKGFSALIYMHRYQSDTMARVQTMYLREYLTKIDSLIEHTRSVSNNPDSSAKDAKEAGKTLTKLEAKQRDALDFDRGDMSRIAALQIAIDLDDGVKVNYQKFKGVLPDIGLSKGED